MKNKINLLEASLSRIYRDYLNIEFAIITSWRTDDASNKENLKKLKSDIRSAGFGYVRIDGVGQEEVDGKIVSVKEPSLIVKNISKGNESIMETRNFLKFIIQLARKYNQWGIVFNDPNDSVKLISLKDADGKKSKPKIDMKFKTFNPMKTAQFFSSLKGKSFTFEGFKYADYPENWIHGMSMEATGEVDIFRYETNEQWMKNIYKFLNQKKT